MKDNTQQIKVGDVIIHTNNINRQRMAVVIQIDLSREYCPYLIKFADNQHTRWALPERISSLNN